MDTPKRVVFTFDELETLIYEMRNCVVKLEEGFYGDDAESLKNAQSALEKLLIMHARKHNRWAKKDVAPAK